MIASRKQTTSTFRNFRVFKGNYDELNLKVFFLEFFFDPLKWLSGIPLHGYGFENN